MTQTLAPQLTIPGMEVDPYQGMTYREKSAMILDQYEDARDNDNVHLLRCWWEFDGLHKVISAETYRKLLAWIGHEQFRVKIGRGFYPGENTFCKCFAKHLGTVHSLQPSSVEMLCEEKTKQSALVADSLHPGVGCIHQSADEFSLIRILAICKPIKWV